MRKIAYSLAILGFIAFLISCNQNSHEADSHGRDTSSISIKQLTLNNGSEWIVDSITADNFVNLKNMTDMFFVNPFLPLANYHTYGSDMKKGINKLMQQCKLTGAAHNALHLWLEPVINQTNELKNYRRYSDSKKTI